MCILQVLTIILCFSCKKSVNDNKNVLDFTSKKISIPITYNELSSYNDSDIFQADGCDYFIGYNNNTHAFDIFDLRNNKKYKSIKLEYQGPHGTSVGNIAANKNYIAVIDKNIIINIFNHEGKKIHKFFFNIIYDLEVAESEDGSEIKSMDGYAIGPSEISFGNYVRKMILTEDNILVLPAFPFQKRASPGYYDQFKLLFIDLNKENPEPIQLNVKYPDNFKEKFYGDFDIPQITYINERLVYSFPVSNEIFMMNEDSTFSSVKLDLKSDMSKITDISMVHYSDYGGRRFDYFFHATRFFLPVYDSDRELYYITYKNQTDPGGEDIEEAGILRHSKYFLSVFDKDFTYLYSIKLPNFIKPIYDITDQGIYFSYNAYGVENESSLSFYLLTIHE